MFDEYCLHSPYFPLKTESDQDILSEYDDDMDLEARRPYIVWRNITDHEEDIMTALQPADSFECRYLDFIVNYQTCQLRSQQLKILTEDFEVPNCVFSVGDTCTHEQVPSQSNDRICCLSSH